MISIVISAASQTFQLTLHGKESMQEKREGDPAHSTTRSFESCQVSRCSFLLKSLSVKHKRKDIGNLVCISMTSLDFRDHEIVIQL